MKRSLAILLGGIGVILIAIISFDTDVYSNFVTQQALVRLNSPQMRVSVNKPQAGLLSWGGEGVSVVFPRAFSSVKFDTARAKVGLLSLLTFSPTAHYSGSLYNGEFFGSTTLNPPHQGSLQIKNIELARHPQLNGLGISGGTITVNSESFEFGDNILNTLSANISIDDLQKPQESKLPARLVNLPLDLVLPPIRDFSLNAKIEVGNNKLTVSGINSRSSLGQFKGSYHAKLNEFGKISSGNASLRVELEDAGLTALGPYLPLISSNALDASTRNFHLNIEFGPSRFNLKAEKL